RVAGAPGQQMKQAADALRNLSEALRARILEHALWQATEVHIRALARIVANPTARFLVDLATEWSAIKLNLRLLIDPSPDGQSLDLALNGALVLSERSLRTRGKPAPPGPSPAERLAGIVAAFDEFRLKARLLFLAVDQALKSEFSSLLPLRDS